MQLNTRGVLLSLGPAAPVRIASTREREVLEERPVCSLCPPPLVLQVPGFFMVGTEGGICVCDWDLGVPAPPLFNGHLTVVTSTPSGTLSREA